MMPAASPFNISMYLSAQSPCRTLPIQNGVLHAPRGHAIAHPVKLLQFALKLPVQVIMHDLRRCHHRQRYLLKLARQACVVIDNGRAVWPQGGEKVIGRQTHAFCKHAPVPQLKIKCDAQVAADVELRRHHLDSAAAFSI